jgi:predicted nucleotidyltransferase
VTNFTLILQTLSEGKVDFVLVGGAAGIAHGASRLTQDVDIVYSRSQENLQRLSDALRPLKPYLRGAPPGLPFTLDAETLRRGLNFTLMTSLGDLDLLGEITGGGVYENLLPHTILLNVFGAQCRCLGLSMLIKVKRAAGRPKDFDAIAELEAILFDEA